MKTSTAVARPLFGRFEIAFIKSGDQVEIRESPELSGMHMVPDRSQHCELRITKAPFILHVQNDFVFKYENVKTIAKRY